MTLYSDEKLKEMNENVPRYIKRLDFYNILYFLYIIIILLASFFYNCYCISCRFSYTDYLFLTHKKEPRKKTLTQKILIVYLIFSPVIFVNIYGLICTIKSKIIYNEYYSMKYIDDFILSENVWEYYGESCDDETGKCTPAHWVCENVCYFNKLNSQNNTIFILYLIGIILIISFNIIMFSIYVECECDCSDP